MKPHRKLILPLLLALTGAPAIAAAPATLPAITDADPAVWVVKDKDTTIYLFGTVHALDGRQAWFNDEVKAAFDGSSELVLEVLTPEDPAAMQPLLAKYAYNASGPTLTSKLSPKGRAALAAMLKTYGMGPTALDRFKPFFAALTLSSLQFQKMGLKADSGAEAVLRQAAVAGHKQVGALETLDYQMSLFDALAEPEQVALLEQTLAQGDGEGPQDIAALVSAWSHGDADRVAAILRKTDTDSPALYKLLLVGRNRNWAQWIQQRLARPGTAFVAVGAGHLAGPDSVQRVLKARGIRSHRVAHIERP
ncbi:MAG: TraB/GumN family protein [Sphingomicrobium sp.]